MERFKSGDKVITEYGTGTVILQGFEGSYLVWLDEHETLTGHMAELHRRYDGMYFRANEMGRRS